MSGMTDSGSSPTISWDCLQCGRTTRHVYLISKNEVGNEICKVTCNECGNAEEATLPSLEEQDKLAFEELTRNLAAIDDGTLPFDETYISESKAKAQSVISTLSKTANAVETVGAASRQVYAICDMLLNSSPIKVGKVLEDAAAEKLHDLLSKFKTDDTSSVHVAELIEAARPLTNTEHSAVIITGSVLIIKAKVSNIRTCCMTLLITELNALIAAAEMIGDTNLRLPTPPNKYLVSARDALAVALTVGASVHLVDKEFSTVVQAIVTFCRWAEGAVANVQKPTTEMLKTFAETDYSFRYLDRRLRTICTGINAFSNEIIICVEELSEIKAVIDSLSKSY